MMMMMRRSRRQLVHVLDIVDEGGTGSVTKHAVAQVLDRLGCPLSGVRFHIIVCTRIETVGESQSCMVSK